MAFNIVDLSYGPSQFAVGSLNGLTLDSSGGLALTGLQIGGSNSMGYEVLSTGEVRYIPAYEEGAPWADQATPQVNPGELIRVSVPQVSTSDPSAADGQTVLALDLYALASHRPVAQVRAIDARVRITTDSEQLIVTSDPADIEWREVTPGPLTGETNSPADPGGSGLDQRERAALSEQYALSEAAPFDRITGARLIPAPWLYSLAPGEALGNRGVWVPEDWTFGPPSAAQKLRVSAQGTFSFGVVGLRARQAGVREYLLRTGPYVSPDAAPPASGTWTSPVTALPAYTQSLFIGPVAGQVLTHPNGVTEWRSLPYTAAVQIECTVDIFDAQGNRLLRTNTDFVNMLVLPGAASMQVSLSIDSGLLVSVRRLGLSAEVKALEFGATPVTRSGQPTNGEWAKPELPMRVRPSRVRMPKHALMASGATVDCYAHRTRLGLATWESRTHLRVPTGTTAAYFDPAAEPVEVTPMTQAQIITAEQTLGQGTWGTLEQPLSTFQLYVPKLEVWLTVDDGRRFDLSLEVTDITDGRISLVGDERPEVDGLFAEAGAGIEIVIDGERVQYTKVVSVGKTLHPNGRVMVVSVADPLDYHNADIETLNENLGNSPVAPVSTEMGYLSEMARRSGLKGLQKDSRLFTRSADFWAAPPSSYGYGGTADDKTNAYNGQGGTVTQELELVANANIATVVAGTGAQQSVTLVPMIPRRTDTLTELVDELLGGQSVDGYVYNSVDGLYKPDTRLTLDQAGYDQTKGYSLIQLEGQSNVFEALMSRNLATIFNEAGSGLTDVISWGYWSGSGIWGVDDMDSAFLKWRYFASQRQSAVLQAWFPAKENGIPAHLHDSLFPDWRTTGSGGSQSGGFPLSQISLVSDAGKPSALGVWRVSLSQIKAWGQAQQPQVTFTPSDGRYNRVISDSIGAAVHHGGSANIDEVYFLVESPKRLKARTPETTIDISAYGPVITAIQGHVNNTGIRERMLEFVLRAELWGVSAEGLKIKPYSSSPSDDYGPAWYPNFAQEAMSASKKRVQKKNTVQNPFVVEILPGRFPDGTQPANFDYPVPELGSGPGPNYQAGVHVATALNLWEWLRSRSSTFSYVGAPSWRPGQFIAVGRRPDGGPGAPVTQYDVFMILEPAKVDVEVSSQIRTSCQAGFVGTVTATGHSNPSPLKVNPFKENR